MLFKKPAGMKFTDMCVFIDANVPNIVEPGKNPDLEDTIYNYLWLLVKALAIKKCMFKNFQDYDLYAFYAANRLYFALRKSYWNQGKVIKGKLIKPIKSCLNYTKALLYPMKIEYQNESFKEVISEEFVSKKFDAFAYKEQMRFDARSSQGIDNRFKDLLYSSFSDINSILDPILAKSPFKPNSLDYKKLKISLLLNATNSFRLKSKLSTDVPTIILWKLPKSMASYVRVLLKEFYAAIKQEIIECYSAVDIDDQTLDYILQEQSKEELDTNEKQYQS